MTGPFFASVDSQTGRYSDQFLPERLSPATLVETIQDTAGGMIQLSPPLSGGYNDTLGQYLVGLDAAALLQLLAPPRAGIRGNFGSTALTASTVTDIALSVTMHNAGMDLATNAGKITLPAGTAGLYLVTASMNYPAGAEGARTVILKVNGTVVREGGVPSAGDTRTPAAWQVVLAAGDVVGLATYVTGTGVTMSSSGDKDINLCLTRLAAA